jgi:hypothetical protein
MIPTTPRPPASSSSLVKSRPTRVPVRAAGAAFGAAGATGEVKDLSRSGLFLSTDRALPPGAMVDLRIELPFRVGRGERVAVIEALGEVCRRSDGAAGAAGVGIRFVRLPHEAERIVEWYVAQGGRSARVLRAVDARA